MDRRATGLILWGLAISALGIWHVVTWVQNTDPEKGVYKVAVGIFCLLVGLGVIAFSAMSRGVGKR